MISGSQRRALNSHISPPAPNRRSTPTRGSERLRPSEPEFRWGSERKEETQALPPRGLRLGVRYAGQNLNSTLCVSSVAGASAGGWGPGRGSSLQGQEAGPAGRDLPSLARVPAASASIDLAPSPPSGLFAQLATPRPAPPHPVLPGWQVWPRDPAQGTWLPWASVQGELPQVWGGQGAATSQLPQNLGMGSVLPSPGQKCCSCSLALWGVSQVWEAQAAGVLGPVLRPPHSVFSSVHSDPF